MVATMPTLQQRVGTLNYDNNTTTMTTGQRQVVRGHLLRAGFRRVTSSMLENPIYYDSAQHGNYREVWQHTRDNTILTCDWDYKTKQ